MRRRNGAVIPEIVRSYGGKSVQRVFLFLPSSFSPQPAFFLSEDSLRDQQCYKSIAGYIHSLWIELLSYKDQTQKRKLLLAADVRYITEFQENIANCRLGVDGRRSTEYQLLKPSLACNLPVNGFSLICKQCAWKRRSYIISTKVPRNS